MDRRRTREQLIVAAAAATTATAVAAAFAARRRRLPHGPLSATGRMARTASLATLAGSVAVDAAFTQARKTFASAPRREILQRELELRSAQQVTDRLGNMKGALMKLGQMASYMDEQFPAHVREVLAQLQQSAPPMSAELAARCLVDELGAGPAELFAQWDPEPIASASIGQVHRAITHDGRAVAVKIQYPGVAEAIAADLGTADLVFAAIGAGFKGLERSTVTGEIKDRLLEELDYRLEARNQTMFAEFYAGHPTIRVPAVLHELSSSKVLTTELATGVHLDEVREWPRELRDRAGETIFRFAFGSLYRLRAFNGDPHPGNYLFGPDGSVTFLDFGLVRHFSDDEMDSFMGLIHSMVIDHDPSRFRSEMVRAGFIGPDTPAGDDELADYFAAFYDTVRRHGPFTFTPEYASAIVRRTFDLSSPVAQHATVPKAYVIIQRINLGLYAILGALGATGNWRGISEELWPGVNGPPASDLGIAEQRWLARRRASVAPPSVDVTA